MAQIPGFLPLNSPWPNLDETATSQYFQWLNAFCDYINKQSVDFSRQSVRKIDTLFTGSESLRLLSVFYRV